MLRVLSFIVAVLLSQMPTQAGATLITGSMILDVQHGWAGPVNAVITCGTHSPNPTCDPALLTFQFNPATEKSFRYLILNEEGTALYSVLNESFYFGGSQLSNRRIGCLGDGAIDSIDTDCPDFDTDSGHPFVIFEQSVTIGLGAFEVISRHSFRDGGGGLLDGGTLFVSAGLQGSTGFYEAGSNEPDMNEGLGFIPLLNTLQLKTVPEPAATGLMLLGIGFIAKLRRRRLTTGPASAPVY